MTRGKIIRILAIAAAAVPAATARADVVTDWNAKAAEITAAPGLPFPPAYFAYRTMAIVQAAVFEGMNATSGRYPPLFITLEQVPNASIEAVIAAATRITLAKLMPAQKVAIETAYQAEIAKIPSGVSKEGGIALGERAAAAVLAWRADDGALAVDAYRPHTAPGVYVPTTIPVPPHWGKRKPWVMTSGDQFRPSAPPPLVGELWARDYNEIKAVGAKNSAQRTSEQTDIARFWEAAVPAIYFNAVRSIATQPGRDLTDNARLLALVAVAMDDALIAIIDAKYAYSFWRPITAIRNGDIDGNEHTERDPSWLPLIDTPMHPEYPCAHCILSAAVGTIVATEVGGAPVNMHGTSPTTPGVTRRWSSTDDFMEEVRLARIYAGVHYRTSTEVGSSMGRNLGQLFLRRFMPPTSSISR